MSDREILLRWLATIATRLGWSHRVLELGRLACALIALFLLAEVLAALRVPAVVLSALMPLLLMSGVAVVAFFAWRLARPTTLAQAAGAADSRAGLRDEIKSAHWFAQRPARDALVDLLLRRAAHTAQGLDARRLVPLEVPQSALAALVLALVTAALAWFSPRIAGPVMAGVGSASVAAATHEAAPSPSIADRSGDASVERVHPGAATLGQSASGSQQDQVAGELPAGAQERAVEQAVAARDTSLIAKLLQALRDKPAAATLGDPSTHATGETVRAGMAPGSAPDALDTEPSAARDAPKNGSSESTARIAQQLGEQIREEQRKLAGTPAQGEITVNPRLRAVNRSSTATQDVAQVIGEAAEAGSQTSVDGTPRGPREGKSRSGGSSGEDPQTTPIGDADAQPVLGSQTVRLEVQLRQVHVERDYDDQRATDETFFAATQRQAAQVGYQDVAAEWRAQRESALAPSRTPLNYRDAVKRYFLTQHDREN